MSAGLLCLFVGVLLFAEPLAAFVAELITQLELRWISGELPWTP